MNLASRQHDDDHVCIHIGLQKTATTFMQRDVFPRLESTTLVRGWDTMRQMLEENHEDQILFSDERISGRPYLGNWIQQFEKNMDLLQKVYNNPAIIIGFRRHGPFLLSLYKQHVQTGGTIGMDEFFEAQSNRGLIKIDDLYFQRRIKYLEQRFERVFVYTQEEVRDDLDAFLTRLTKFMGVQLEGFDPNAADPVNVGLQGQFQTRLLIRLNRMNNMLKAVGWLPSLDNGLFHRLGITPRQLCQNRLRFISSEQVQFSEETQEFLDEHFRDDWQFVQQRRTQQPEPQLSENPSH